MKIALYIEDGLEQVVLTPETKTERGILGKLSDGSRALEIKHGQFYDCNGGWKRWRDSPDPYVGQFRPDPSVDDSTIIVLRPVPEPKVKP